MSAPSDAYGRVIGRGWNLAEHEGGGGVLVLIPDGWKLRVTFGGDGTVTSTWKNPRARSQRVVATVAPSTTWIAGRAAVDKAVVRQLLPTGAKVVRESKTEFRYSVPSTKNVSLQGSWIAEFENREPVGFRHVEVAAPRSRRTTVIRILRAFSAQPPVNIQAVATTEPAVDPPPVSSESVDTVAVWIAIAASLPSSTTTHSQAWARADALAPFTRNSPEVLLSDDFPGLNAGYLVVYMGRFAYREHAVDECDYLAASGITECYPRAIYLPADVDVDAWFAGQYHYTDEVDGG